MFDSCGSQLRSGHAGRRPRLAPADEVSGKALWDGSGQFAHKSVTPTVDVSAGPAAAQRSILRAQTALRCVGLKKRVGFVSQSPPNCVRFSAGLWGAGFEKKSAVCILSHRILRPCLHSVNRSSFFARRRTPPDSSHPHSPGPRPAWLPDGGCASQSPQRPGPLSPGMRRAAIRRFAHSQSR